MNVFCVVLHTLCFIRQVMYTDMYVIGDPRKNIHIDEHMYNYNMYTKYICFLCLDTNIQWSVQHQFH